MYAGPELGSERGTPMIIKKALLKSSGTAFRVHLAETLLLDGTHKSTIITQLLTKHK